MPLMPRAGWLASGAIGAAVLGALGIVSPGFFALIVTAGAIALLPATALAWKLERGALAALLFGLATILLRMALAAGFDGRSAEGAPLPAGQGAWQAQVEDLSAPSGTEQRAFLRLYVAATVDTPGWRVYAWLPRHPALVPGDLVSVEGQLDPPPPNAPGFAGFLAARGAVGTLKAGSLALVAHGSGLRSAVERLRWSIDGLLGRALPEPEAGLAAGILVGLRERVSRIVADDFTTTGLTHVVAISGWNIALVAGIATGLLRATGLGRRWRSLLVMAAIAGYTLLAGAEASVVRAAVMGGVVLLAREGGRPADAAAALGLACWGLLIADPDMVTDIGLQLSLAATAGLLALGGPAEAAVQRLSAGRAPRWFCETLGVSLAAQVATLPLILLHFGRLSLISPLANLLVAPVVPLAMLGALVGALLGPLLVAPIVHLLLAPVSLLAWLPLAAMVRGAALLSGVPFASVDASLTARPRRCRPRPRGAGRLPPGGPRPSCGRGTADTTPRSRPGRLPRAAPGGRRAARPPSGARHEPAPPAPCRPGQWPPRRGPCRWSSWRATGSSCRCPCSTSGRAMPSCWSRRRVNGCLSMGARTPTCLSAASMSGSPSGTVTSTSSS